MKNIIALFVLATTLLSCSSSDDNATIPTVLQKVVFYRNSPNEKHWNINNDLLTNITLADGTVVEEFVYDTQNRLVTDIKYTNGVATETTTITYNANNIITSINGLPYTFNATTRTYAYSYGSNFTIDCKVNKDFLVVDFIRGGFNASEYHMTYSGADMTSFKKVANGSTELIKNFHFDQLYTNPLQNAVLAVARVKSLTDPNFFIDSVVSTKIAGGFDKGASDPYYYSHGYSSSTETPPNHSIKDFSIGVEILDSSNNFVDFYSFADYYYE